jgi:hypothetical protein
MVTAADVTTTHEHLKFCQLPLTPYLIADHLITTPVMIVKLVANNNDEFFYSGAG